MPKQRDGEAAQGTSENEGDTAVTGGLQVQTSQHNSSVSERVDADDTVVAFAPRIPPHMQPFANTGGKSSTGRTTSRILGPGMLFFSDDSISCEKQRLNSGTQRAAIQ